MLAVSSQQVRGFVSTFAFYITHNPSTAHFCLRTLLDCVHTALTSLEKRLGWGGGGRSMEGEEVKVQMSLTRMPVDDNTKLYSKPPMENPEDERRRRNAIIAWKNRVWKKRQYEELQTMVNTLEETNKKLNDANHRMEEDLRAQRQKLDLENSIVTQLKADKSSLETLIQNQQENLAFIREHLMLINRCSEEDSPVRKFLTALLNTMNSSSPISFTPTLLPVASLSHHSSDIPTVPPPTTSPPCSTYPRLTTSSLHVSMLPKEASLMPSLVPIPKSTVASQHFPRNRVGSPPHEV
ncbi:hypothetical protein E2C01_025203 [Portunus trituberculatus]|uniref:BZIP domain-containing protein n=1 Tax=Portunus trituberculatus TaxID=210409 RepID=A0A5B7EFW1_PORTR|nr:hypothetical protein [Portunus trituberculatus]